MKKILYGISIGKVSTSFNFSNGNKDMIRKFALL